MSSMLTGQKLRAIRALRAMTQAQLAEKSGVSQVAIAEYETGKRDLRVGTMRKLLSALGVSASYAIGSVTISD